jgi:Asp-tRNA(Asn)/Glu-tRNA(Gln) amidotransferase A subunit family amidase
MAALGSDTGGKGLFGKRHQVAVLGVKRAVLRAEVRAWSGGCAGSIRQPAAWTGIVGLKPSYGRVSRHGLLAYGSSTDVIGPMARTVTDVALLASAMGGHDPNHDATTSDLPVPDYVAALRELEGGMGGGKGARPLGKLRVGIIRETLETRVEVTPHAHVAPPQPPLRRQK